MIGGGCNGGKAKTLREEMIREAAKRYGSEPEYLWAKFPDVAVMRHQSNRKWFVIFMEVERCKLGLDEEGMVDILNVRLEPDMVGLLAGTPGYLPGYHMNKKNWLTVLLDGTVDKRNIFQLLDRSFELTDVKRKRRP